MNSNEFLEKLDSLFDEKDIEKVDNFLDSELKSAKEAGDD